MNSNIVDIEPAQPDVNNAARELDYLQAVKGGMLLQHSEAGISAFGDVRAVCCFLNEEKRPLLLLFIASSPRPFIVEFANIRFDTFRIPPSDKPAVKFRKLMNGLCKFCTEAIIERKTYEFATGTGRIASVTNIPGLCAGFHEPLYGSPVNDLDETVAVNDPFFGQSDDALPSLDDTPSIPAQPAPLPIQNPEQQPDIRPGSTPVTMVCPKCRKEQKKAEECAFCGVFVERYIERLRTQQERETIEEPELDEYIAEEVQEPEDTAPPDSDFIGQFYVDRIISIDSLLKIAIGVVSEHAIALMAIVLPILLFYSGAGAVLSIVTRSTPVIAVLAQLGITLMVYSLMMTAVYTYLDSVANERQPSIGEAYMNGFQQLAPVMWSRFTNTILVLLGLTAFCIPGIIFATRSIFIEVVGAVGDPERKRFVSLGHISQNLSEGYVFSIMAAVTFLSTLLLLLLYGVIFIVSFVTVLFSAQGLPTLSLGIGLIIGFVALIGAVLFLVTFLCFIYFIYMDLYDIKGDHIYDTREIIDPLVKFVFVINAALFLVYIASVFLGGG